MVSSDKTEGATVDKTIIQFTEQDLDSIELNRTAIVNEINDKIMEWAISLGKTYSYVDDSHMPTPVDMDGEAHERFLKLQREDKRTVKEYRFFWTKTHRPQKTFEDYLAKADDFDKQKLLEYFKAKYEPSAQGEL